MKREPDLKEREKIDDGEKRKTKTPRVSGEAKIRTIEAPEEKYLVEKDVDYVKEVIKSLQANVHDEKKDSTQLKRLNEHTTNFNCIVEMANKEKVKLNVIFVGQGGTGKSSAVSSIIGGHNNTVMDAFIGARKKSTVSYTKDIIGYSYGNNVCHELIVGMSPHCLLSILFQSALGYFFFRY